MFSTCGDCGECSPPWWGYAESAPPLCRRWGAFAWAEKLKDTAQLLWNFGTRMLWCDVGELAGQSADVSDGRPESAFLVGELGFEGGDGESEGV